MPLNSETKPNDNIQSDLHKMIHYFIQIMKFYEYKDILVSNY